MNISILTGRLTRDPELRFTPSGIAVAKFTLAVDRPYTNNEGKRDADFIPVVVWKKTAEAVGDHLKKGQKVGVQGRIQTRSYEKDGRKVYITEIVAENVEFPPKSDHAQSAQSQASQSPSQSQGSDNNYGPWIDDDDLPF